MYAPRFALLLCQADLIVDADGLAKKIVIMKTHFPSLDTVHLILKKPKVFVLDAEELDTTCQQVCAWGILSHAPLLLQVYIHRNEIYCRQPYFTVETQDFV